MWGERLDASVYNCVNKEIAEKTKKMLSEGMNDEDILSKINADTINKDAGLNLFIEQKKFSKGDDPDIDKMNWEAGVSGDYEKDGRVVFYVIHGKLEPQVKTLDEAKGPITSDYQDYLEKEWIKELKAKYPVKINKKVLNSIK